MAAAATHQGMTSAPALAACALMRVTVTTTVTTTLLIGERDGAG
jgi:hypothetical protein